MAEPPVITLLDEDADFARVWAMLEPAVRAGDTIALPADATVAEGAAYWRAPGGRVYVATREGADVGSLYLRAAQRGPGDHVANAGFVTAPGARGGGVGRAMGVFALEEARRLGFTAMQFNFVVSTNTHAVALWRSLGFAVIGTSPGAFRHPTLGAVDAYVMHRLL
ncbi:MAG: GNAT family N-acetyltransferase [Caulobacterales bacterium]|nr:GNAT family N-acetyltransferase [Caulobacterales bacterium]